MKIKEVDMLNTKIENIIKSIQKEMIIEIVINVVEEEDMVEVVENMVKMIDMQKRIYLVDLVKLLKKKILYKIDKEWMMM